MTSAANRGPRALLILASMTLLCAACASAPPTVVAGGAYNCSDRIPPKYLEPTPGADLDLIDGTQGGIGVYADKQTGQLDLANDIKDTVVWIFKQCETEKQKAVDTVVKPRSFWSRITGN